MAPRHTSPLRGHREGNLRRPRLPQPLDLPTPPLIINYTNSRPFHLHCLTVPSSRRNRFYPLHPSSAQEQATPSAPRVPHRLMGGPASHVNRRLQAWTLWPIWRPCNITNNPSGSLPAVCETTTHRSRCPPPPRPSPPCLLYLGRDPCPVPEEICP